MFFPVNFDREHIALRLGERRVVRQQIFDLRRVCQIRLAFLIQLAAGIRC
jgi:hypothetical protein